MSTRVNRDSEYVVTHEPELTFERMLVLAELELEREESTAKQQAAQRRAYREALAELAEAEAALERARKARSRALGRVRLLGVGIHADS